MPRPNTRLVSDQLLDSMGETWFNQLCTIQEETTVEDGFGQDVPSEPTALSGHEDIPCRVGVSTGRGVAAQSEQERALMTTVVRRETIALKGYFPDVKEEHIASVAGVQYDIEDVHIDSEKTITMLVVEHRT